MKNKTLRLYVHIPFCMQKCSYCDFLSFRANEETRDSYAEQLMREIRSWERVSSEYQVDSVFFGGGTPSVIRSETTESILSAIRDAFVLSENAEITTEANPGTLDQEKLRAYRSMGFNRLSLGLQTCHDEELKMLGRIHDFDTFLRNYEQARDAGFNNINVDLISGIPGQTLKGWESNLETVASLQPGHISAYSLILEPGTLMGDHTERFPELPDEETERSMYECTAKILHAYGYEQYEISNYAKPGMACRHNIGYWTGDPYLGFGLGAASYFEGMRFQGVSGMEEYLQGVSYRPIERIQKKEAMEEYMILGLRMTSGIRESEFLSRFGSSIDEVYGTVLKRFTESGHLMRRDGVIRLTREGISVSNVILSEFLL